MTDSKFRLLTASALVLSLAAAGSAFQPASNPAPRTQPESKQPAQPANPGPRGPGGPEGRGGGPEGGRRGEGVNVGGSMKLIGRSLRMLHEQIDDATKKDDNLRLINDAERGAVTAKGAPLPQGVLKHAADDAAKAKLADTFRTDLVSALRMMLDIETEIAGGKTADAKKHLEELIKLRDKAHGEMGIKED